MAAPFSLDDLGPRTTRGLKVPKTLCYMDSAGVGAAFNVLVFSRALSMVQAFISRWMARRLVAVVSAGREDFSDFFLVRNSCEPPPRAFGPRHGYDVLWGGSSPSHCWLMRSCTRNTPRPRGLLTHFPPFDSGWHGGG
jgi:hypothetical protein